MFVPNNNRRVNGEDQISGTAHEVGVPDQE
jgi:hypothetical protein